MFVPLVTQTLTHAHRYLEKHDANVKTDVACRLSMLELLLELPLSLFLHHFLSFFFFDPSFLLFTFSFLPIITVVHFYFSLHCLLIAASSDAFLFAEGRGKQSSSSRS